MVLVLGGARSGKSAYALSFAEKRKGKKFFFATAEARDAEMRDRVSRHRAARPSHWKTVEVQLDLIGALLRSDRPDSVVLVDCLTLWLSNLIEKRKRDSSVSDGIEQLSEALSRFSGRVWLVSNEVGLGIVPSTPVGRRFRDLSGRMNREIAAVADEVYWVTAGLPQRLK